MNICEAREEGAKQIIEKSMSWHAFAVSVLIFHWRMEIVHVLLAEEL